jgi:magnesium transporter
MPRFISKVSKKAGLSPGALVHVGKKKTEKARITIIDYDESQFQEKEAKTIEECFPFKESPTTTWINIDGLHEVDLMDKIGKHFGMHPLVVEDILNTGQRVKMEDFDSYLFVVLKMLCYDQEEGEIRAEQVSLILGSNFVISFQEREGDVFNSVRERIKSGKGRIRKMGPDYLAYALVDAIVDRYFIILEKLGEEIESIEEEFVHKTT